MDSNYYSDHLVLEAHLKRDTYQEFQKDCDVKVMNELNKHVQKHKTCLTSKEIDYLTKFDWQTSNFYALP